MKKQKVYSRLYEVISKFDPEIISSVRKEELQNLTDYIKAGLITETTVNLNFICTHNSRRSQFAQVWAQVAAFYYDIAVQCYSGGVEVTAFNERAVASLKEMGFKIVKKGEINPRYFISFSDGAPAVVAFSKVFDDETNPSKSFAAVMTCSDADANCPFIPGAEKRIPIKYEDPKAFDNTLQEKEKYTERSLQIANEMFYLFSLIK